MISCDPCALAFDFPERRDAPAGMSSHSFKENYIKL
jgi:hypothetical protein